jgi:hypothetical protein
MAIDPEIVLTDTRPNTIAPKNSNTAAMYMADRFDKAPDPTDVPNALATSLAPVP